MNRIPVKRFHIVAWGSDKYPDLDYETDDVPTDLNWKYQYVSIALQVALPLSAIISSLDTAW